MTTPVLSAYRVVAVGRRLALLAAAALLVAAAPAEAASRERPTVREAQRAAVLKAKQPSAFDGENVFPLDAAPSLPRRWTVRPSRCSRHYTSMVLRCWVLVGFPEWPGCSIYDLYRVGKHGRRIVARKARVYTSSSTECPGFGTMGLER